MSPSIAADHGPPNGARGRPRSADADTAILAATRAALVELGWGGLTMGDVAARAGVAKTTLYRRWAGQERTGGRRSGRPLRRAASCPTAAACAADIEDVVLQFAALLERPETKTALMAVVAESTRDEALRRRVRERHRGPAEAAGRAGPRPRAQARGELPPDDDARGGRAQTST